MRALLLAAMLSCATTPRVRQRIARDFAACLEANVEMVDPIVIRLCVCKAQQACLDAGLDHRCAFDDWQLEGVYAPLAAGGRCGS